MKQKILVTGGTGFIGSHTTVELQNAGYEVVIVDNLSNSNENVIDGIEKITGIRPAFEKVDCCDIAAMEGVFKKYAGIQASFTSRLPRLSVRVWRSHCFTTVIILSVW